MVVSLTPGVEAVLEVTLDVGKGTEVEPEDTMLELPVPDGIETVEELTSTMVELVPVGKGNEVEFALVG